MAIAVGSIALKSARLFRSARAVGLPVFERVAPRGGQGGATRDQCPSLSFARVNGPLGALKPLKPN